jgi:hypothetical protein
MEEMDKKERQRLRWKRRSPTPASRAASRSVEKERQAAREQARQIQWLESEFAIIQPEKCMEATAFHIPLAYREGHGYTHLGNLGDLHEQTDRPGPGHPGHAYP